MASNEDTTNTVASDDQTKDLEEATENLKLQENTEKKTDEEETEKENESESESETEAAAAAAVDLAEDFTPYDFVGVRTGKCRWFNVLKGYGFVTPDDGTQEIFVHQSVIQMNGFRSLDQGEAVEFECVLTRRGLEATRVSGIDGGACSGSLYRPRSKRFNRRQKCYNCGEFDHIADNCPMPRLPKSCHFCKRTDHLLADCPLELPISNDDPAYDPNNATETDAGEAVESTMKIDPSTEADAGGAVDSTKADAGEAVEPNNSS